MIAIKHVLVATDFSPPSNTALNYGRAMARTFGATLHVLHVLEAVPRTVGGEFGIADTGGLTEELKLAARRELDSVVDDDDRRDLHAKPVLAIASHAAAEITAYAANEPVDIIIMGTHGRGALAKILMGSVAERVVRTAPCPVLTVRHSPA